MSRKATRQAIVDALINQTAAADRVFRTKVNSIDGDHTPAIAVYINRTSSDDIRSGHILQFKATHEIKVEAYVADTDDWDDNVEDLIDQIEARLFASSTFNIFDHIETITGYETSITYGSEGEVNIACGILTISGRVTRCFNPGDDPALPNFLTANVNVDLEPTDGTIDASAEISLEPAP